jgi:hypothetical protein
LKLDAIQLDWSYADAEGVVRRCDGRKPGIVFYTVLACPYRPEHVGKTFVSGPGWFAAQAVRALPPANDQENLFEPESEVACG